MDSKVLYGNNLVIKDIINLMFFSTTYWCETCEGNNYYEIDIIQTNL